MREVARNLPGNRGTPIIRLNQRIPYAYGVPRLQIEEERQMNVSCSRCVMILCGIAVLVSCGAGPDGKQTAASAPGREEILRQGEVTFSASDPSELEVKKARTGQLLVRPTVNEHEAGWFIFDTGAGICCVDKSAAASLNLEPAGEIAATGGGGGAKAPVYRARDLKLGPMHCADHPLMAVDLAFLEQHLGEKISGIIGFGVFQHCVAVIDLQKPGISLHDPGKYELSRGKWTALDLSERVPIVTAVFEGHEGRFVLDTGDNQGMTFNEPAVREWKLLDGRDLSDSRLGGVGGFIAAKSGKIARLELGGLKMKDVPAAFALEAKGTHAQAGRAGKIGAVVLQRFILVIDYGRERIAFQRRAKQKPAKSDK